MTLADWATDYGYGAAAKLARAIGVPRSTVTRWIRGERVPSTAHAVAIEIATSGAVRAEESIGIDEMRRKMRGR